MIKHFEIDFWHNQLENVKLYLKVSKNDQKLKSNEIKTVKDRTVL